MATRSRSNPVKEEHPPPAAALKERVVLQLEADILAGSLRPGDRIDERTIAERIGVSRTPVREAIAELAAIGLIDVRPRSGTFVAAFRVEQMFELLEALRELEAACARLASQRMSAAEKAALLDLSARCDAAAARDDRDTYIALNAAWHAAILGGAHNAPLHDAVHQIRRRAMPFRNQTFHVEDRLIDSAAEHKAISNAIVRGDGVEAERLIRHHLDFNRAAYATVIEAMRQHG